MGDTIIWKVGDNVLEALIIGIILGSLSNNSDKNKRSGKIIESQPGSKLPER